LPSSRTAKTAVPDRNRREALPSAFWTGLNDLEPQILAACGH
jgi:hypothetical protein